MHHEFDRQPKTVPFDVFLLAAEHDGLAALNLPDITEAVDSTYSLTQAPMPPQVDEYGYTIFDVRELATMPNRRPPEGHWNIGDSVQATVNIFLRQNTDGKVDVRAAAQVINERGSEDLLAYFNLSEQHRFTPEEIGIIGKLGLLRVNARLRLDNIVSLSAVVEQISAVQRPFDGNFERLTENAPVMVEGTVVSYQTGRRQQNHLPLDEDPTAPHVVIRTPDGVDIRTHLSHDVLRYRAGVDSATTTQAVTPPYPMIGDQARVSARYRTITSRDGPVLATDDSGSIYLLGGSGERFDTAQETEAAIKKLEHDLANARDPAEARHLYGAFMSTQFSFDRQGYMTCHLSDYNLGRVQGFLQARFEGTTLRNDVLALDKKLSTSTLAVLQHRLKVNTFGMSRRDLAELTIAVANGDHPIHVDREPYLSTPPEVIKTLTSFIAGDEVLMEQLVDASLRNRYYKITKRLAQNQMAYSQEDLSWMEESLKACVALPNLRHSALRIAEFCQVTFSDGGTTYFHSQVRLAALDAMRDVLIRCAVWENQNLRKIGPSTASYPNRLLNLVDGPVLKGLWHSLKALLPQMHALNDESKKNPYYSGAFSKTGTYTDKIRTIEQLLTEFGAELPPKQE